MALPPKYDMAVYPTAGLVRSASDGAKSHQVTLASCDCADFTNRRGQLVVVDDTLAVTVCKHVAEFLERVAGWHRPAASEPALTAYPSLSRQQALTVLTSSCIAADLAERILKAARAADDLTVTYQLASGEMRAQASPGSPIWYSLWLPASQSAFLPESVRS